MLSIANDLLVSLILRCEWHGIVTHSCRAAGEAVAHCAFQNGEAPNHYRSADQQRASLKNGSHSPQMRIPTDLD